METPAMCGETCTAEVHYSVKMIITKKMKAAVSTVII